MQKNNMLSHHRNVIGYIKVENTAMFRDVLCDVSLETKYKNVGAKLVLNNFVIENREWNFF